MELKNIFLRMNQNSAVGAVTLIALIGVFTVGVGLAVAQAPEAAEKEDRHLVSKEKTGKEIKMLTKTLSGKVSARGPNGIAVVYEKDEVKRSSKEMWFPYEEEIMLSGYEAKTDIGEEDLVTVTYEEAEDGSKRILKAIKLDKKYEPPPPEAEDADEEEEGDE